MRALKRPLVAALLFAAWRRRPGEGGRPTFETRCASCNAAAAGASPGAGPNLAGVVGRRAGGDPGFGHSPMLEAAPREGKVRDAAMVERLLTDPEEIFPGLWMGENVLRAAEEPAAVTAFPRTTR